MNYFTAGGLGNRHRELTNGTNKPPPTRRIWERSKGEDTCPTTSQNPSHWYSSWLSNVRPSRKDPEPEWLVKDNVETNLVTIKPKTSSLVGEQPSWVPLLCCSPSRSPFPIKSLSLSARVSPGIIHFWVLDKSPLSDPGRESPSLQWKVLYEWMKNHC